MAEAVATKAPPVPEPELLPPGPRAPKALQTLQFMRDPIPQWEGATERFGETFTLRLFGPGNLTFISDPPSIKKLFAADRVNTIAPGRNILLEPLLGRHSVLLAEDDAHMRRRKLMLPPFHGERMRAYESVIEEATRRQVESWPEGERFPLHPSMQALTLEVILRAVFGVEDSGRRAELSEHLVAILSATQSARAIGMAIPRLHKLPPWRSTVARIQRSDELLAEEIRARRADTDLAEREDILSMLVAARFDDGSAMDDRDIRDQLMTLLLAGHETTATSLAWAFDLLFHHPDAMQRLREEVEGEGDEWLEAVISESMRLRPVVPFTGRQLRESAHLGGHDLPEGGGGDGRDLFRPHARRRLRGRPLVQAGALPRRRAGDLLVDPVRRRHRAGAWARRSLSSRCASPCGRSSEVPSCVPPTPSRSASCAATSRSPLPREPAPFSSGATSPARPAGPAPRGRA